MGRASNERIIRSKRLSPDNPSGLAMADTRPRGVVEPPHGMNQRLDLNNCTTVR